MSRAKCIMVQGTMSGAGKSLLCAALCRIFAQDGYKTAPFKSQNMALNSFVTRDGLEMGRAQVVQAQAAGVEPDVRMNPILLKPSSDVGSQVIVNGEVRGDMPAKEYFRRKKSLIPDILRAYDSLADEFDIIVIEGAGSPAEINLKADDIVNMGLAKLVDAPVLLAGDIDRGGVFAQLYGTVALLEPDERARICGLIINKFRGDVEILHPGLAMLEEKTQLPVLGVVPYLRVDIEDEDSLAPRLQSKSAVKPLDGEPAIIKHAPDAFFQTDLHDALSRAGIRKLVVSGMMSHMCIDTSVRAARNHGYDITLLHDACATRDLSWNGKTIPAATVHEAFMAALHGAFADVRTTEDFLPSLPA